MRNQDDYSEHLATQLRLYGLEIDLLTVQTEKAAALMNLNYVEQLAGLRAKQQAAVQKMQEIEAYRGDEWDALKESSFPLWHELRSAIDNTTEQFKHAYTPHITQTTV